MLNSLEPKSECSAPPQVYMLGVAPQKVGFVFHTPPGVIHVDRSEGGLSLFFNGKFRSRTLTRQEHVQPRNQVGESNQIRNFDDFVRGKLFFFIFPPPRSKKKSLRILVSWFPCTSEPRFKELTSNGSFFLNVQFRDPFQYYLNTTFRIIFH